MKKIVKSYTQSGLPRFQMWESRKHMVHVTFLMAANNSVLHSSLLVGQRNNFKNSNFEVLIEPFRAKLFLLKALYYYESLEHLE